MHDRIIELNKRMIESDVIPFMVYDAKLEVFMDDEQQIRVRNISNRRNVVIAHAVEYDDMKAAIDDFLAQKDNDSRPPKTELEKQIENIHQLLQKFKPVFEYTKRYEMSRFIQKLRLSEKDEVEFINDIQMTCKERILQYINKYGYVEILKDVLYSYKKLQKHIKKFKKNQQKEQKAKIKAENELIEILNRQPTIRYCQFCGKTTTECRCDKK